MPLNPPSYVGQDVWYSPNVFINKVQTALWQPPQGTDPAQDPSIQAWTDGCDIAADGSAEGRVASEAYVQGLTRQGVTTPDQVAVARTAGQPTEATQRNDGAVPSQNPVGLDTDGVENMTSWSRELQLSRRFTLGSLLAAGERWNSFLALPLQGSGLSGNLPKGRMVANLKLLAINTLDKIKDRYPTMAAHSTWRPFISTPTSQHNKGQAADMNFGSMPFEQYYDVAVWIKDNVDFDQMLLEYNNTTCWIHISWQARNSGDPRQREGRGAFHVATFNCLNPPGAAARTTASGKSEERYRGLLNLAPNLGLSGYSMVSRPSGRQVVLAGTVSGQTPI